MLDADPVSPRSMSLKHWRYPQHRKQSSVVWSHFKPSTQISHLTGKKEKSGYAGFADKAWCDYCHKSFVKKKSTLLLLLLLLIHLHGGNCTTHVFHEFLWACEKVLGNPCPSVLAERVFSRANLKAYSAHQRWNVLPQRLEACILLKHNAWDCTINLVTSVSLLRACIIVCLIVSVIWLQ